jgi:hypothetical protein
MRRRMLVMFLVATVTVAIAVTSSLGAPLMAAAQSDPNGQVDGPLAPESPSALPRANSGRAPVQAGDRGGALQLALFGVLVGGLATIGTVIVRSSRRHNRAIMTAARPIPSPPHEN